MTIDIRPFQETDRSVVRQLTIAGFEGVSIDHNIEVRLGRSPAVTGNGGSRETSTAISTGRAIEVAVAGGSIAQAWSWATSRCTATPRHELAGFTTWRWSEESRGQGVGPAFDRARPFAFPRGRNDHRQDRDPRTERNRAASLSIGRFCRSRPADSLRDAALDRPSHAPGPEITLKSVLSPKPLRLEMRHISKSFGGVRGARDVSISAARARWSHSAAKTEPARARS